jgi:hypothetical protein
MALFILIELLLIFDKTFSKFNLWGPLHLYDGLLLLLALIASIYFFNQSVKFGPWPILAILSLSIIYLGYSLIIDHNPTNYVIRQYALFVYLGLGWLIYSSFINIKFHKYNIRFIILISIASVIIQLVYTVYLAIFTDDFSLFGHFNYYSSMVIVGIIVFGAYVLVFVNSRIIKVVLVLFYLILSMTLGHASAFLAAFTVFIGYIIIRLPLKAKITGVISFIISVFIFLVFLPQFNDHNAEWRLIFWKYSLKDIVLQYYTVLGHGFGVPYPSQEMLGAFSENINSPWFDLRPGDMYLIPMHNSFITIAFHVGLVPSLLFFIPLFNPIKETLLTKNERRKPQTDFLILSWLGLTVWSSFNVILELPHSSMFYWLVYFTLIYQFNFSKKEKIGKET